jgi:hypothetical protein
MVHGVIFTGVLQGPKMLYFILVRTMVHGVIFTGVLQGPKMLYFILVRTMVHGVILTGVLQGPKMLVDVANEYITASGKILAFERLFI